MWARTSRLPRSTVGKRHVMIAVGADASWRLVPSRCFSSESDFDGRRRGPDSQRRNRSQSKDTSGTGKPVASMTRPDYDRTSRQATGPQLRDDVGSSFKGRTPKRETVATSRIPRPKPRAILGALVTKVTCIQSRLDQLKPRPPISCSSGGTPFENDTDAFEREVIFRETQILLNQLNRLVAENLLSPSKHRHEFTVLLERVLKLYCEAIATPSDFEECRRVLQLLSRWKLDVQQSHVDHAIAAAARVQLWREATQLFESQIDPDAGCRPFDVSVSDPVGLFSVARHAQESAALDEAAADAVDRVMDAVLRMSMVSPTDQESYLLAAGAALGRAGEWQSLIRFLRANENVERLGQTLIAAVMHACLLCDQPDQALGVYDEYVVGKAAAADEWHWGGGENKHIRPLCRDLAMRALGEGHHVGVSDRALEYYWDAQHDGVTVSVEALCGVVDACRRDGKWEDAMSVFFSVLAKSFASCWLVPGLELSIAPVDSSIPFRSEVIHLMGNFLGSVLKSCNEAGHFGIAILSLQLLNLSIQASTTGHPHFTIASRDHVDSTELVNALSNLIPTFHEQDTVLESVMMSLDGLNCRRECLSLFEILNCDEVEFKRFPLAQRTYEAVLSESQRHHSSSPNGWPSMLRQIGNFTLAFHGAFVADNIAPQTTRVLSSWLSNIIEACSKAAQPQTGIKLALWVDLHSRENEHFLPASDALVASLINAHSEAGQNEEALEVFSSLESTAVSTSSLLAYTAAIKVLFQLERDDEAIKLFEIISKSRESPDLASAVAEGLARAGAWDSAMDVYRLALSTGCLSEELGLVAIKSVSEAKIDGRLRVMRNIVEDIADLVGIKPNSWLELKYWDLKRLVGFSFAARLMWWNDPKTRHLEELNFALHSFETRRLAGLTPKNDVLRLIVSAAMGFSDIDAMTVNNELPSIPRDNAAWIRTLNAVVKESENSSLFYDAKFVESVSLAFAELGGEETAMRILGDADERGLSVQLYR